jgi:hypothetical protein
VPFSTAVILVIFVTAYKRISTDLCPSVQALQALHMAAVTTAKVDLSTFAILQEVMQQVDLQVDLQVRYAR